MLSGQVDGFMQALNKTFDGIDYVAYPVTGEASCRAMVQVMIGALGYTPKVEVHSALGRSDLEVTTGSFHWVFEFKLVKTSREAKDALAQGIHQMQIRRYGQTSLEKWVRVVAVFSQEERQWVAWQSL